MTTYVSCYMCGHLAIEFWSYRCRKDDKFYVRGYCLDHAPDEVSAYLRTQEFDCQRITEEEANKLSVILEVTDD